ncbi:hypothetical protein GTO91_14235 [Heliobacterium undosum]|uniref:Glutamine amidotransferase domain-containing protein n=1 Tax=Heliomicrobium undosum TaxID=121734 RepID=A0A845L7U6_9FIRM|nr:hypothetical protein [Heliomicrobium undosum]MZP30874.1 hypothetical protein [Heliomicrobium undosum]
MLREQRNGMCASLARFAAVTALLSVLFPAAMMPAAAAPMAATAAPAPTVPVQAGTVVAEPVRLHVVPGYGGDYKPYHLIPIRVKVSNNGAPLKGLLRLAMKDTQPQVGYHVLPVSLDAGETKTYTLFGSEQISMPNIVVRLESDEGLLIAEEKVGGRGLNTGDKLIGVLSEQATTADFLGSLRRENAQSLHRVQHLSEADIPETAQSLKMLDVLVINGFPAEKLSAVQTEAITGWVENGGILILGGGAGYRRSAAPWLDLSPVSVHGETRWNGLRKLAEKAGVENVPSGPLTVAMGKLAGGRIIVEEKGIPIIALRPVGDGKVLFCAYDLAEGPVAHWPGNSPLWSRLLLPLIDGERAEGLNGGPRGIDFWQSLAMAAERIPAFKTPPIGVLAALLGAYILIAGPILYHVMGRWGQREWNWLAIPVAAVLFGGGLFLFGAKDRMGGTLVQNLSVVELHDRWADITTGAALFVPEGGTYRLQAKGGEIPRPLEMPDFSHPDHQQVHLSGDGDSMSLEFRDVEFWSLRKALFQQTAERGRIASRLVYEDGKMAGTVINQTPYAIRDARLLYGAEVIPLGDLPPGEAVPVDVLIGNEPVRQVTTFMGPASLIPLEKLLPGDPDPALAATRTNRASRERDILGSFFQGGPVLPSGEVEFFGWTDDPVVDYEIPGHPLRAVHLGLVHSTLDLAPGPDGSMLYAAGAFTAKTVNGVTEADRGANGFLVADSPIILDYMITEPESSSFFKQNGHFTPTRIRVDFWTHEPSFVFKKEIYDWHRNGFAEWDKVASNDCLDREALPYFLSPEGRLRFRFSHEDPALLQKFIGLPHLFVEGRMAP